jgi:protein-tyrosine phosphatase
MAERLARQCLGLLLGGTAGGFEVSSTGTHARDGAPMHPYAAHALRERGADPEAFQARSLTAAQVARADLVLTATREHRARCVQLSPASITRCFTLRQWTRLVDAVDPATLHAADPASRARSLWKEALAVRSTLQPVPVEQDDLPDPLGRPVDDFRTCAAELERMLRRTSMLISGG